MNTFGIDIDPTKRNPIYDEALRLCDISNDVPFLMISAPWGIAKQSRFIGSPFLDKISLAIRTTEPDGTIDYRYLSDLGIIKYYRAKPQYWNPINFCIINTPESLKRYDVWLCNGGTEILAERKEKCAEQMRNENSEAAGEEVVVGENEDEYEILQI